MSPLRYPGGKRRLVPYLAAALKVNEVEPGLFVEPYAGGAACALELAASGVVERIGLADRDPLVASFWRVAFEDSDWLIKQVGAVEVSLKARERMKTKRHQSDRSRALACLLLNRTSFNGSLNSRAGAIGGQRQSGEYLIDCRFPRERLTKRLEEVAALADKVAFVRVADALDVVKEARAAAAKADESLTFYFDPPFWAKSDRLYRFTYGEADHRRLANALRYVKEPLFLSYDDAPEVAALYAGRGFLSAHVELLYVATQRTAERELMITNQQRLPSDSRLWRTSGEWRARRRGAVRSAP